MTRKTLPTNLAGDLYQPLVSVIVNCYNGERFLKDALDSIFSQSYPNWEIVFWDNASTDRSADIAKGYGDRIRYFRAEKTTSIYLARSLAVGKAKGSLVAFLDCDDWWEPYKLMDQVFLFKDESVGFAYGDCWLATNRKKKAKLIKHRVRFYESFLDSILRDYVVVMATLVIRKSSYDTLEDGFNSNYNIIGDFDIVVRLSVNWSAARVTRPLAYCRVHDLNYSRQKPNTSNKEMQNWYDKNSTNKSIASSRNYRKVQSLINYVTARDYIFSGQRKKSIPYILGIKSRIKLFIKSVTAFALPLRFIKWYMSE